MEDWNAGIMDGVDIYPRQGKEKKDCLRLKV